MTMKLFRSDSTQPDAQELQEQAARAATAQLEGERAHVAALKTELRTLCTAPWPGRRSRIWAIAGGKGGSLKTTTTAIMAHYIGEAMMLMTVCADFNPDLVTLQDRVIEAPRRGRLQDLAAVADKITYPVELLDYVEPSAFGREFYLTSAEVLRREIHGIPVGQLQQIRYLLSMLAQATIFDTGTTYESPAFRTALGGADQLVLGFTAGLDTLGKVNEVNTEIAAAGYAHLLVDQDDPTPSVQRAGASVLLSIDSPNVHPAQLQSSANWITMNAGAAFIAPYDPALDSKSVSRLIRWDLIQPATEIALLQFVLHAVRSAVTRPPRVPDLGAVIDRGL